MKFTKHFIGLLFILILQISGISAQQHSDKAVFKNDTTGVNLPRLPIIMWNTPLRTDTIIKTIHLKATIKSNSELKLVKLYLNNVCISLVEPKLVHKPDKQTSYSIEKTIDLSPGASNLYILATNREGTTKSEIRNFKYPSNAETVVSKAISALETENISPGINLPLVPIISWTSPSGTNTTLKSLKANIKAIIKSPSELKSVKLYLNNVCISYIEPKVIHKPNEIDSYQLEKNLDINPGDYNVYILATNLVGTTKSEIRYFNYPSTIEDTVSKSNSIVQNANLSSSSIIQNTNIPLDNKLLTAPIITWTSPSGINTSLDSYNGIVRANIRSSIGLNSVLVYLNGISKGEAFVIPVLKENGSYMVEKNINFSPGENIIYIVATNSEGATKSDLRYFKNPMAVLPNIKWSNPTTTPVIVNSESIPIEASIISTTDIKSVKLIVNGETQTEDNVLKSSSTDNTIYDWRTSLILKKGENSIYISATNLAGSIRSEQRIIKYDVALAEKRLALVFGNSQYKNGNPLRNPVNDANLIEVTLKELGFDVIKRLNAGKAEMEAAIREFTEKLPQYNVALFYYAGHGNQMDGKNYLIPTDALMEKPTDFKFEAIAIDFVVDEFERYPDNTNIVILDACRNNPFASWSRGGAVGFKQISFTSGTIIAFATSEGATAADGTGANGLYTEELVKQMTIPQSLHIVFLNTRNQVRKLSNNQQIPMEWDKLNSDFYLKK